MSVITPPPLAAVEGTVLKDLTAKDGAEKTITSDELKEEFGKLNIRMVCVLHEAIPAEVKDFWPEFWGGELYLDSEKKLYKALGNGKLRRGSLTWFLNPWSVIWQHAKWAKEECGITKSNLKGDGLTMGGLMVIKKGAGGPSYAFAEERFGDHASFDEVFKACQAASH